MLKIEPAGARTILERLRSAGIMIESPCNGKGLCGKCKVRVLSGQAPALTEQEEKRLTADEIASGIRLACLTVPESTVEIDPLGLLEEQAGNVLGDGETPDVPLDPLVTAERIAVHGPDLKNCWSLCEAVENAIGCAVNLPLPLLRKLPELMGKTELWYICHGGRAVDLRGEKRIYGLAVDIGTTTVAAALIDLDTGNVCAEDGFVNPQKAFGLDVLSRIHYDMEHPGGVLELQKAIVQRLQQSAENLYPGMTRPLYFSHTRYNMHLTRGSLLIEVGTDANTLDEAVYSGSLLGDVLIDVLNGLTV